MGFIPALSALYTSAVPTDSRRFLSSSCFVSIFCYFNNSKMRPIASVFFVFCMSAFTAAQACPDYADYAAAPHAPFSGGVHNLSYQRPAPSCRTFTSPAVESTIARLTSTIVDPDLSRLFENSFPNTLDTAIKWKGYAADNAEEELTFVITGDMYTVFDSYGV